MTDGPGVPRSDSTPADEEAVTAGQQPVAGASAPGPEELGEVQERIEERIEAGTVEAAADELEELHPAD